VRVCIVFDGPAPRPARAQQIGGPDIQVTFSGAGISADAVLADIIQADSAARRMLVVSTDREVARVAKRRRARHVRSEDFWTLVQRDLARPVQTRREPPEKRAGLSAEAVQRWLDEFGLE
jgi:hypothetical protein